MNGSSSLAVGLLSSNVQPSLAWRVVGMFSENVLRAGLLPMRLGFEGMREGQ